MLAGSDEKPQVESEDPLGARDPLDGTDDPPVGGDDPTDDADVSPNCSIRSGGGPAIRGVGVPGDADIISLQFGYFVACYEHVTVVTLQNLLKVGCQLKHFLYKK